MEKKAALDLSADPTRCSGYPINSPAMPGRARCPGEDTDNDGDEIMRALSWLAAAAGLLMSAA
ncbi:MAG: hypothetical protein K1X67_10665, partial [Fimbriimonadaceae bacterium]|nr:hypothetical protein [Fimbriimonadaceae bacterium]